MRSPLSESRILAETIQGPAGRLEASIRVPPEPRGAAVVAHPHPLHGGTMHTKVVHRASRLLADRFGLISVRFNFRGVGTSDGRYDQGRGEVEDLVAACRHAQALFPEGPFILAGFSFGALCAMWAGIREHPVLLFLLGIPLARWERQAALELGPTPVVWVHGENDEFGDGTLAQATADRFGWDLAIVPGSDHYFTGKLDEFEDVAVDYLRGTGLLTETK